MKKTLRSRLDDICHFFRWSRFAGFDDHIPKRHHFRQFLVTWLGRVLGAGRVLRLVGGHNFFFFPIALGGLDVDVVAVELKKPEFVGIVVAC